MTELTKTEQSLIADEYQGYGLRENAKRHGLTRERARSILSGANKKLDIEQDICEACDGTGQIQKHPAGVRTTASYAVTCGACFGKGGLKSINAVRSTETAIRRSCYGRFWAVPEVPATSFWTYPASKPNNAPASGINPQDSIERAV